VVVPIARWSRWAAAMFNSIESDRAACEANKTKAIRDGKFDEAREWSKAAELLREANVAIRRIKWLMRK